MPIPAALVLLAIIWFVCLFAILPLKLRTQDEAGSVIPGTPASAPKTINLIAKVRLVTLVSVVIWIPLCAVIISGVVSIADIDVVDRLGLRAE